MNPDLFVASGWVVGEHHSLFLLAGKTRFCLIVEYLVNESGGLALITSELRGKLLCGMGTVFNPVDKRTFLCHLRLRSYKVIEVGRVRHV